MTDIVMPKRNLKSGFCPKEQRVGYSYSSERSTYCMRSLVDPPCRLLTWSSVIDGASRVLSRVLGDRYAFRLLPNMVALFPSKDPDQSWIPMA